MKKIIIAAALLLSANAVGLLSACGTQRKASQTIKVRVDYILRNPGDSSEIWVKRRKMYNNPGYVWYMAKVWVVPDTLYVGKELWLNLKPDTCKRWCIIFKQIK